MKFCYCGQPVFGKGFCKNHQYQRLDFDNRSILQKGMDRHKKNLQVKSKVRSLITKDSQEIGSMQGLIHDLDSVLSLYIRLRHADKEGLVKCYCCSTVLHYTKMHNSHFIPRSHMATRFLEDNCKESCPGCNLRHNDDQTIYKNILEKEEHGIVEWLMEQSSQVYKFSLDELKEMIIDYRAKVKICQSKLIINANT